MSTFSVPLPPDETSLMSSKEASKEAFYATAGSSSKDLVADYRLASSDLQLTGTSSFVESEKQKWQNESDRATKNTITGILGDKTIAPEVKKALLKGYAATGTVPTSLRERYIQKTAAKEEGINLDDTISQEIVISNLNSRIEENKKATNKEKVIEGSSSFGSIMATAQGNIYGAVEAISSVGTSVALSIPAGIAGIFELIKERDPAKAANLVAEIQSRSYAPTTETGTDITKAVIDAATVVGIPAEKIGEFTLEHTDSPGLATAAKIGLDPINYIPFGMLNKGIKSAPKKVTPTISNDAPIKAAEVANPKVAENLATAALKEPTGELAIALGVDKGQIVHDWVLPKLLPNEVAKAHPDLMEAINRSDLTIRETFQDMRYDPNIINATKREAEVEKTFQIIKESRSPYYNQSMSMINETDQLFEGKAIFGRNGHSGYVRERDAKVAFDKLQESINKLPDEQRGTLSIVKEDGHHYIQWQWKKEYDEIANLTFGKDSIQTSVLGVDVSGVARSSLGRWLFPTGRFPKWLEFGALRGIERSAKIREDLTKTIRDNIANTRHGVELDYLIREAEETGTDYFSKSKMASMFPKLSTNEVDDLFATHTFWRRQQHYNHNFMNREHRHRLLSDNMQGLYDKAGNYIGAASIKISEAELAKVKELWDMDNNIPVKYNAEEFTKTGKTVVRLQEKVEGTGSVYHYAVIGEKTKLDLLPREVLPRIPGYSGRKVAESFYVDIIPKRVTVNGLLESNPTGVRSYTKTKAAAATEHEANKIAEQMRADNPEHIIEVRPERTDNWGRVLTDYNLHQEFLKHSMKKGERLPSLNGLARIEDRMVTLLNTTSTLSRMGAFRAWDESFQSAFTKGFSKFTKGEFPQYATDIKPLENMGRELKQEYDTAHALFKYYERMKNTETRGDFLWSKGLNSIADILEKWKIPAGALRGKHENPLMLGKTIATVGYIHMAPIRQWIIQPAQQLEMYAINPSTAAKNWSNTLAIRMYLGSESSLMNKYKEFIQPHAMKAGQFSGEKEFLENVEAIKKSGLMQSVDMNSIVHGVFKEVDRQLVENTPERIWRDIETAAKAVPRLSRSVGFDAAELTNRVGNWLQVKDAWIAKNEGKSWKTKEAQEEIAAEASRLSGAMNRAGALPYQEGVLSVFFQFAAINHKMLLNLIQDNATILSPVQRAKLGAARFALYGGKYGVPGGAIAYYFINQSEDEEVKKNAEAIKRGTIDYAANKLLASIVEPDEQPDLAVSKMLSPYSESFLPYFQVGWETMKLFDDAPAGPRYPAFGMTSSFNDAIQDMRGWWITREVNDQNYKQMFMEAAETASGFNSYTQGLLMLGMRDKITKMGNKYGMEFTASEAYAKMIAGIGTQKEEDLWKLVELEKDVKGQKKEMAKIIHRQMMNQRYKLNDTDYESKVRKLNAFISLLDPVHFSEADKLDVINEVEKLDKHSFTTIKQSILSEHWKYHQEKRTQEWMQVDDILRRSTDPETQKYIKALDEGKL